MKNYKFKVTFTHCTSEVYCMSVRQAVILASAEMISKGLDSTILSVENVEKGTITNRPRIVIHDEEYDKQREVVEAWFEGLYTEVVLTDELKEEMISEINLL